MHIDISRYIVIVYAILLFLFGGVISSHPGT